MVVEFEKMTMLWATCWWVVWCGAVEYQKLKCGGGMHKKWRRCDRFSDVYVYIYMARCVSRLFVLWKGCFEKSLGESPWWFGEDKRWLHSFVPRCQRSDYTARSARRKRAAPVTPTRHKAPPASIHLAFSMYAVRKGERAFVFLISHAARSIHLSSLRAAADVPWFPFFLLAHSSDEYFWFLRSPFHRSAPE